MIRGIHHTRHQHGYGHLRRSDAEEHRGYRLISCRSLHRSGVISSTSIILSKGAPDFMKSCLRSFFEGASQQQQANPSP